MDSFSKWALSSLAQLEIKKKREKEKIRFTRNRKSIARCSTACTVGKTGSIRVRSFFFFFFFYNKYERKEPNAWNYAYIRVLWIGVLDPVHSRVHGSRYFNECIKIHVYEHEANGVILKRYLITWTLYGYLILVVINLCNAWTREGRFWDYMFEASTGYAVFIVKLLYWLIRWMMSVY